MKAAMKMEILIDILSGAAMMAIGWWISARICRFLANGMSEETNSAKGKTGEKATVDVRFIIIDREKERKL